MNKKTEIKDIELSKLVYADWNVHQEERKNDRDFNGFCRNIKEVGLIHRVVVRPLKDGLYEIVDGHRRAAALMANGEETVPCEVLPETEDTDAKVMTISANLQRKSDDPFLQADAIASLLADGKTQKQVAATLGMTESFVARRSRIISLVAKWRKRLAGKPLVVIEAVASYEQDLQKRMFDKFDGYEVDRWVDEDNVRRSFSTYLFEINEETQFDTTECAKCPSNTATHGFLFPKLDDETCAKCQNGECFVRKWNAETDRKISALRGKKVEVKEVRNKWDIPNSYLSTPEKTNTNKHPYVFAEDGRRTLVWSVKAESRKAAPAMTQEEKEAARIGKRAHKAWTANRRSAYDKIREKLSGADLATFVKAASNTEKFTDWAATKFVESNDSYIYDAACQDVFEFADADLLKDYGIELSDEEVAALGSDDPAKVKGEEA